MARLTDNQRIGNYTIVYFIKETFFCSSYKVLGRNGEPLFMKVFDIAAMPDNLLVEGVPKEIIVCKTLDHKNIIKYVDNGKFSNEGVSFHYLITDFFVGELLAESLLLNGLLTLKEKYRIIRGIAEGLQYMNEDAGLSHNDICPRNIVLVSDPKTVRIKPIIIDLGHASEPVDGSPAFPEEDIELVYRAPETFSGNYSYQSDVFSLSVLMYKLFFGKQPWDIELDKGTKYQERVDILLKKRRVPVDIPTDNIEIETLLKKGLSEDPFQRPSYEEILAILTEDSFSTMNKNNCDKSEDELPAFKQGFKREQAEKTGGGFDDVAGMDSLKKELSDKVIWVLKNKEIAKLYRITPPNGMLLYGPPGCGKTFFAQKFTEETGFNYQLINGSDIGSTLVHGSQLKIGELFQEAEKNAPTVLCFDEFDAFVPVRGAQGTEYVAEEVNEFLSQLNNCSKRGIFVIGTTNRKDMIDPAVLRKGRLDLHYYVPEPDFETRKLMFQKHLSNRPLSADIDYDVLAGMTDNYASSDIAYIVNEAALAAALAGELIGQRHLEGAVRGNKSSLETNAFKRLKIGF